MVPFSVTLSDPLPRFQGHGVIFRPIYPQLIVWQVTRDLFCDSQVLVSKRHVRDRRTDWQGTMHKCYLTITGLDRTYHAHRFVIVSHFNFLFIPCGRLSWLSVSFLLHAKYALSYRISLLEKTGRIIKYRSRPTATAKLMTFLIRFSRVKWFSVIDPERCCHW